MAKDTFPTVYDAKGTRAPGLGTVEFKEPSRTKSEFKEECDINRLMARYVKHGVLPPTVGVGRYGDFSDVVDFQQAQFVLERARAQFAALPADVRDAFKNDPARMLAFVADKKNIDEARKLGLLKEEPPQAAPKKE